jgi:hypothetical protein
LVNCGRDVVSWKHHAAPCARTGRIPKPGLRLALPVQNVTEGSYALMTKKKEAKKFPYVERIDELNPFREAAGGFLSPEGAAKMLMTTRSQLVILESRGDITGFRLRTGSSEESKDIVFISHESVKAYAARKKAADAAKAEAKLAVAAE